MRALRGFGLILLAIGALCTSASAQPSRRETVGEPRSVVLANRHLAAVRAAYLSPVTDPDWGPERLDGRELGIGEDRAVEMRGGCQADLRILFASGGAEERRAVDICGTTRIVLRPGWTIAEQLDAEEAVEPQPAEPASNALRLRNAGRLPIVEIYAFPSGAPRGEDRLGDDTLPIGAEIEIDAAEPDACAVDLVAIFRDGREVTRSGVDLCAGEEIELR